MILGLALASTPSFASTTVAIYAIVDGLHQPPTRGHLYFSLNPGEAASSRKEWEALREAAGTGQVVGFGQYWMPCGSSATATGLSNRERGANCSFEAVVHTTDRTLATPGPYPAPGSEGVVTVFDDSDDLCPRFGKPSVQIVAELREAHSPGSVRGEPPPCPEWIGLLASYDLDKAFRLQARDGGWADAAEALILKRFADVEGLRLASLSVQCRDTVCRIHVAFPSAEYEETTGNLLAGNALRE
jgi:hypothetical protein